MAEAKTAKTACEECTAPLPEECLLALQAGHSAATACCMGQARCHCAIRILQSDEVGLGHLVGVLITFWYLDVAPISIFAAGLAAFV